MQIVRLERDSQADSLFHCSLPKLPYVLIFPHVKMADRSFADRVVLPITAAIYRNGEEKQAVRWSFEMGIGGESDKMLFDSSFRVREGLESQISVAR